MKNNPKLNTKLLQKIQAILSQKFQTEIKIKSTVTLSEELRRNLVLRVNLEQSDRNIPQTIIFKQSLIEKSTSDKELLRKSARDKEILGRFARDWAGLEFISSFDIEVIIAPKFYGGSVSSRFILIEDLGANHLSLVDPLMSNKLQDAKDALNRYMKIMAKFHGNAHQNIKNYSPMLQKIDPDVDVWQDGFTEMPAKIRSFLGKLNIEFSLELEAEMNYVFKLNKEPGPFIALMHGDICPDNLVDDPDKNQIKIIDFEWSYIGNALLDAVYLRMYMPTCWCVMAFPDYIIEEMDLVYRKELSKFILEAKDDKLYYEYYVGACAYTIFWRLLNIEYVLDKEMSQEDREKYVPDKWKAEYNIARPRQLLRLKKFIELANKHDALPHIKLMAEAVLIELNKRWLDVEPMEYYPAFR
jgi:thiamine kinase-like enzyme